MVDVAEMGKEFVTDYDRRDRRLRVIYDNGTESDSLLRSLQRALHNGALPTLQQVRSLVARRTPRTPIPARSMSCEPNPTIRRSLLTGS